MSENREDDRGYCETYDCKYYENLKECQKQNCWYRYYSKEHIKNIQIKKQLQAKEQECEKLKTQYNCYACETCNGREDYRNMKRHCENAIKAIHRYKQSLDEIEKYIKNQLDESAINSIQSIINKAKKE